MYKDLLIILFDTETVSHQAYGPVVRCYNIGGMISYQACDPAMVYISMDGEAMLILHQACGAAVIPYKGISH